MALAQRPGVWEEKLLATSITSFLLELESKIRCRREFTQNMYNLHTFAFDIMPFFSTARM